MEMEEVRLGFFDGEELMARQHIPRRFCIDGLLPQGVSILGGYPKAGKSLLVMDWALHIAKGIPVWGMEVTQGTVLYMCLEDTEDRLRHRLSLMTDEVPKNICFATAVGTLSDTLEAQIDFFMRERPDTVLIIIDTFQLVRAHTGDPTYSGDYTEVQKMKEIADRHGITILLVLKFSQSRFVWELVSDRADEPEIVLPAELDALLRYMKEAGHFRGGNQELCRLLKEQTGVAATPKGLKQKMNVWKRTLAELGITFESRKANGERSVEIRFTLAVAQGTEVGVS